MAQDQNQIYNQAQAMTYDARTPGLNSIVSAWAALQNFTGQWAVNNYNGIVYMTNLIGGFAA